MLSAQHLQLIAELLDDERSSLDAISNNFRQAVPNKSDHFGFCSALHMLLQDDLLVSPLQRIIAYYLLYSLYPLPLASNPFFPAFAASLDPAASTEPWERNFCASFVDGLPKDVRNLLAL